MRAFYRFIVIACWLPALSICLLTHFLTESSILAWVVEGLFFVLAIVCMCLGAIKWDEWFTMPLVGTRISSLKKGPLWVFVVLKLAFPWSHLKVYKCEFQFIAFPSGVVISKKELSEGTPVLLVKEGDRLYFARPFNPKSSAVRIIR